MSMSQFETIFGFLANFSLSSLTGNSLFLEILLWSVGWNMDGNDQSFHGHHPGTGRVLDGGSENPY